MRLLVSRTVTALVLAGVAGGGMAWVSAQQARGGVTVAIDPDDIGGVVSGPRGPEAGVWVVAETTDLPTRFTRIVTTNDQGRYVVPDLPKANYDVFVRGYGLVDSPRVKATPGRQLNLTAVAAPDGRAAAQVYPPSYWLGLMEIPKGELSEQNLLGQVKECIVCHQLGDKATREIPKSLGTFASSAEAWDRRVTVGPSGTAMAGAFLRMGAQRKMFADWTDKIAAGAFPRQAPARPAGLERNIVVTLWDWAVETGGRSDGVASDERRPSLNANGPVYGVIQSDDLLTWVDPATNKAESIRIPSSAPPTAQTYPVVSPYFTETIWKRVSDPRSLGMDGLGRLWLTARVRGNEQPGFCKSGSSNMFAKFLPFASPGNRQVMVFDPKTKQFSSIDTCFTADHNHFSADASNTVYYGMNNVLGWINTTEYDKSKSGEAAQGWCPAVLDTNGDGKITEYTEMNQPADPQKDRRISFGCYSVSVNQHDGSAWCAGIGPRDNKLVRIERGNNPPQTCKAEVYEAPATGHTPAVFKSGGVSVDAEGVVWLNWRGTDYMTSFDRRKCKVTNGPTATGQHCPEGWSIHLKSGAQFQGVSAANSPNNADMLYLTHVDSHNALGLGENVPVSGSVNTDSLLAFVSKTGQFVELRVPYPMGFFARSAQGRIDDPNTGWKGRGLWSTYSSYTPWHQEGGKGSKPKLVKFQVRPSPLAK
jgi:hypothetical protein